VNTPGPVPNPPANTEASAPALQSPAPTTSAVAVKVHGAEAIPDSVYWTGHGIGFALIVVATVWIFAAKGPTRKDAVKSLLEEANAKEDQNAKTV
jgi:hypothetical protein